ncbi:MULTISPECIES: hypothetical protein [Actinokineospora]|nr:MULTISPECIES: hypothetical protein [Actinokineospora]UVS77159.1 hypothetical protein Actkin_00861 [Actinokineospora sp. UTMC 2448]
MSLVTVQALVSQMQGDAYTPKLGTSPVGQQLARKFDDRLNSDAGLRPLLAEAVRRMDEFIHSAESVRDAYTEAEEAAEATMRQTGQG